jgi:hypothetical protein
LPFFTTTGSEKGETKENVVDANYNEICVKTYLAPFCLDHPVKTKRTVLVANDAP